MNKIIVLVGLYSFNAFANSTSFGRIVDLKGTGFISYEGKTRELKKGDSIEVGSEIVIEHRGQVSFSDNADHRYHLGNASSVSVKAKTLELRSGDLWFQSLNKNDTYKINTANSSIDYQGGEAIVTYDSAKGKTQMLVINGMMKLSNLRATDLNLTVGEGHFSFIDNAYEEGAPRDPTPVGEKTYGQLVSLFSGILPMDKNSEALFKDHATEKQGIHREVASVHQPEIGESKALEEYKESLLVKSHPQIAKGPMKKVMVKNQKKIVSSPKSFVSIFGQKKEKSFAFTTSPAATKSRAPASVLDQEVPKDAGVSAESATPSNLPYTKEFKNTNKESDKLIKDLKNL